TVCANGARVASAGEDIIRMPNGPHGFEHRNCRARQWNAVLLVRLHPLARHGPNAICEINLIPRCDISLANPRGGQHDKFKPARRNASVPPNLRHESASLRKRQGGVMLDLRDLGSRRQRVLEQPAPSSGIIPGPVMMNSGPAEHVFDPATNAGG